jgi:hypothetical protein
MAILPLQSDALRSAGNLHLSALAAVLVGATDEGLAELRLQEAAPQKKQMLAATRGSPYIRASS